jgi:hypothetical protein
MEDQIVIYKSAFTKDELRDILYSVFQVIAFLSLFIGAHVALAFTS